MHRIITIIFVLIMAHSLLAQEEKTGDYIQFDDRKNTVHGVYIGLTQHLGKLENEWAGFTSLKLAYVANRKLEIGLEATLFYSEVANETGIYGDEALLIGAYGGLHLEPILYGNKFVSVSFPLMIGGGGIMLLEEKEHGGYGFTSYEHENKKDDYDYFFIVEPGINLLYNISRFVQIETGIKYRFSEKYDIPLSKKDNINGFSAGIGLKIGIFNMGRNKKVKDNF